MVCSTALVEVNHTLVLSYFLNADSTPAATERLDTIFRVAGPMSFYEKTKFLRKFYDSQLDIEAIPLRKLREISKQVDLKIDEIVSWFDDENVRLQEHLASRNFSQHQFSFQLPPSPTRTSTYGHNIDLRTQ